MRTSLKEKALNYSLPFQNFARTTIFLTLAFLGANLIALDQLNFQVRANATDLFGHKMEKVNVVPGTNKKLGAMWMGIFRQKYT